LKQVKTQNNTLILAFSILVTQPILA